MKFTITLSFFLCISNLLAQPGFTKIFTEIKGSLFHDLLIENDTIVLYGISFNPKNNRQGIYFAKLDTLGNVLMENHITDPDPDAILTTDIPGQYRQLVKTKDGGYAMVGTSNSLFLLKVDHNLQLDFIEFYPKNPDRINPRPVSVVETDQGFLLLFHDAIWNPTVKVKPYIIRTNSRGKERWRKAYGDDSKYYINSAFKKIGDNEFVISETVFDGYDIDFSSSSDKFTSTIFAIDSLGNKLWESKKEEIIGFEEFSQLDDGWICSSHRIEWIDHDLFNSQPIILKFDKNFNKIWETKIGEIGWNYAGIHTIKPMPDGNFICSGRYRGRTLHVKISNEGDIIWQRYDRFSEHYNSDIWSTIISPNGSIFSCGFANIDFENIKNGTYGLLMKITSDGCIDLSECTDWVGLDQLSKENLEILISPNPTSEYATFTKISEILQKQIDIKIYDVMGKHIQDIQIPEFEKSYQWDVLNLPNGVYFCQMYLDGELFGVEKLIKQ